MSIVPQRRQYCLTSTLFQHQQSNDDSLCIFNLLSTSTQCLGSDFRRWFWLFNQRNLARWQLRFLERVLIPIFLKRVPEETR